MEIEFDEDFKATLESEDELGLVVRVHIHLEVQLNQFIDGRLAYPTHLKKAQLDYAQKVSLAVALGLFPKYEAPLLALGKLRNAFAHQPGTKLTSDRVAGLYKSLSSDDKSLIQESHMRARRKRPETKIPSFSRLPAKTQFILLAISLRSLLIVAVKQDAQSN